MKLSEAIERLRFAGVPSPEYDAGELFRYALGIERSAIIPRDKDFQSDILARFIKRREEREPLQYIIGEVCFYREEYTVTPDVLIPRSDTEMLVDYAVKNIPEGELFFDLCTGSGCIAVSTLSNTKNTRALAVDISERAIKIAKTNAARNGVADRLDTAVCDVLSEDIPRCDKPFAVLSNPPYVTAGEYEALEPEIYREPKEAFVGGDDGLVFYERLLPMALELIKDGGFAAFEIGYMQGEALRALSERCSASVEIIKDYSGCDRVAVIRKK